MNRHEEKIIERIPNLRNRKFRDLKAFKLILDYIKDRDETIVILKEQICKRDRRIKDLNKTDIINLKHETNILRRRCEKQTKTIKDDAEAQSYIAIISMNQSQIMIGLEEENERLKAEVAELKLTAGGG